MTLPLSQPCWTAADAREVLVTEALAGDDALFLATHTAVRGFDIAGSARDVETPTEEGLLSALSNPDRRHAFCVVQGEPGSGKSHLIRWLSVNWDNPKDLPILVQRANGSLEGALRQLQARLPEEFQPLFQSLGRRQAAGMAGRASQFLLTLGGALAPNFFEKPLDDTSWCAENDPSSLLLNAQVRQAWAGPLRILKLMDGGDGERNSETASFNLEDICDLGRLCGAVHDSVASEKLARKLIKETAFIREAMAEGQSADDIKLQSPGEVRTSLALIDALNARRNFAVQQVIGVSADGLKKLFEELRTELAKRGERIILLLEDITSWEGLDDSLVDALVTDADTRPDADLCPLISVVGVTPEYFQKLAPNYRQRITHDVRLGQQQGQLQDVAALREAEDRAQFVRRYMNAARVGPADLRVWRERFRSERSLNPPNACHTCPRVEPCHAVFGEVDGVGLFPFTREAIDNFFHALKEDDGGQTHRTPRGILQGILSPTLLQPRVLSDGQYPGAQLESGAVDRRILPGVLQGRLNNQVADDAVRERLRRLLAYWGDRRPELRRGHDGHERYAGVSRALVAAFGLPWIADEHAAPLPPAVPTPPPPIAAVAPAAPIGPTDSKTAPAPVQSDAEAVPLRPDTSRPRPTPTRPTTPTTSRAQLERMRADITAMREGETLQNSTAWNTLLFEVFGRVDFRKLSIDRFTWNKVFTAQTVKIAGTGATRAQHLVVERTAWLVDGLEAYAVLKTEEVTDEEAEFSRRRLAFMMRGLEQLAAAHVEKRLPKTESGETWTPAGATVQLLLARAWLRGTTSADRPTHEQWTEILSDETNRPGSEPGSRTQAWQDALTATDRRHDALRIALHEMARLPQGAAAGFGIADASEAAAAITALIKSCRLNTLPREEGTATPDDIAMILQVAARMTALPTIPQQERKLLTSRGELLVGLLREQGINPHLLRLDAVISEVAAQLPTTVPHLVREWKAALDSRRRLIDDAATSGRIQSAIFDLSDDPDPLPARSSLLLGWLASAPAGDLKGALDLAQLGEKLVIELLPHVQDIAGDASKSADFAAVHSHGATLRAAAAKAMASLTEPAE